MVLQRELVFFMPFERRPHAVLHCSVNASNPSNPFSFFLAAATRTRAGCLTRTGWRCPRGTACTCEGAVHAAPAAPAVPCQKLSAAPSCAAAAAPRETHAWLPWERRWGSLRGGGSQAEAQRGRGFAGSACQTDLRCPPHAPLAVPGGTAAGPTLRASPRWATLVLLACPPACSSQPLPGVAGQRSAACRGGSRPCARLPRSPPLQRMRLSLHLRRSSSPRTLRLPPRRRWATSQTPRWGGVWVAREV